MDTLLTEVGFTVLWDDSGSAEFGINADLIIHPGPSHRVTIGKTKKMKHWSQFWAPEMQDLVFLHPN